MKKTAAKKPAKKPVKKPAAKKPVAKTAKKPAKKSAPKSGLSPAKLIDGRIEELGDWRGETLGKLRALIKEADPEIVEEWKWRGVPTWYDHGIVCTGETYRAVVKTTFASGAAIADPNKLFNSSLKGGTRRAIDFFEGDPIDAEAFKTLVRDAVLLNKSKGT